MPAPSTVVSKPEPPKPVWKVALEVNVAEPRPDGNGWVHLKKQVVDPQDTLLAKMAVEGRTGYATVTKDGIPVRSMHVTAMQFKDLYAAVEAGVEPRL